jgi:hypothetical protein
LHGIRKDLQILSAAIDYWKHSSQSTAIRGKEFLVRKISKSIRDQDDLGGMTAEEREVFGTVGIPFSNSPCSVFTYWAFLPQVTPLLLTSDEVVEKIVRVISVDKALPTRAFTNWVATYDVWWSADFTSHFENIFQPLIVAIKREIIDWYVDS